jgi:hypothetical protein
VADCDLPERGYRASGLARAGGITGRNTVMPPVWFILWSYLTVTRNRVLKMPHPPLTSRTVALPKCSYSLTTATGGTLINLHASFHLHQQYVYATRGIIHGFTRTSRRRLLDFFASIDQTKLSSLPLFVTLTYPAQWDDNPAAWKQHLDRLSKRLVRRFPDVAFVWKLEYQKREAPHFHLILFGVPYVAPGALAVDWYECVGSGDTRHLSAGTSIEACREWGQVTAYAAKYLAKIDGEWPDRPAGRYWGVYGRARIPVSLLVQALDGKTFAAVRRSMWLYAKVVGYRPGRKHHGAGVKQYGPSQYAEQLVKYAMLLTAASDRSKDDNLTPPGAVALPYSPRAPPTPLGGCGGLVGPGITSFD